MESVQRVSILEALTVILAAAAGRVRQALQAYDEARSRAAAQRELHRLSNHMLRDIGLRREDFHS